MTRPWLPALVLAIFAVGFLATGLLLPAEWGGWR